MRTCGKQVWEGYHYYRCGKPAKTAFMTEEGKGICRCGIHAIRERKNGLVEVPLDRIKEPERRGR